ncbi:MAG: TolC family protein [Pseudomonadota bacterium]
MSPSLFNQVISRITCLLIAYWMSTHSYAEKSLSLAQLEDMLDESREVEIATAEIEERIYLLKRERLRRGVKLFASAGYSDVSEVITDDLRREYQRKHLTLGLSYPLFGTHANENNSVLEAEDSVYASEQRRAIVQKRALATLRRNYIDYWTTLERLAISKEFLSIEEQANNWLVERTRTGHVLEADRLEFMTAFDLARRATASDEEIRQRTLGVMALLTEDSLPAFEPEPPHLPSACMNKMRLRQFVLDEHPEIKLLRSRRDTLRSLRKRSTDVEGHVHLSTSIGQDEPSSLTDNGVALSVNLRMPMEFLGTRKYARYAKSAELRRANLELDRRTEEVVNEVDSAIGRYRTSIENLSFAETRVAAALETVRERQLRAASLVGDTLEKLQQAKFGSYRTSIDLVDAEGLLLKATVGILAMSERECLPLDPDLHIEPDYEPIILAKPLSNQWANTLNLRPSKPNFEKDNKTAVTFDDSLHTTHNESVVTAPFKGVNRVLYDVVGSRSSLSKTTKDTVLGEIVPQSVRRTQEFQLAAAKQESSNGKHSRPHKRVRFEDASGVIEPHTVAQRVNFQPVAKTDVHQPASVATARTSVLVQENLNRIAAPVKTERRLETLGTYVWKSHKLISSENHRQRFWSQLKSQNVNRVLLSLNGKQIRSLRDTSERGKLMQLLVEASKHRVTIELLLGEPSWVLPKHRGSLLSIIQDLESLPFDGLHLDIEPGMFDERLYDRREIMNQLADTVDEVSAISAWPLSMSLHYRDLSPGEGYCLGCRLSEVDIDEITLMIYVSNPKRVAEIASRVSRRYPQLKFSVAQSVEPILGSEESHASAGRAKLNSRLERLKQELEPYSISSLLLQSWTDLQRMSE